MDDLVRPAGRQKVSRHVQVSEQRVDRLAPLIGDRGGVGEEGSVHQARTVEQQPVGHASIVRFASARFAAATSGAGSGGEETTR